MNDINENKHNNGGDMGEEIRLKRQLIEATDSIRKKFNSLKRRNVENQLTLEKIYEPITKPLKVLSAASEVKSHNQVPTQTQTLTQSRDIARASTSAFKATPETSDEDVEKNVSQTYFMETPPRSSLMSTSSSESPLSLEEKKSGVIRKHLENLKSGDPKYDTIYGVRLDPHTDKLRMGDTEVRFSNGNITLWRGNKKVGTYAGSPKLYDVIFMKYPPMLRSDGELDLIGDEDFQKYGEILKNTKAAYKNYDMKQDLNKTKWKKFSEIIKPLISSTVMTRSRTGLGFSNMPLQKLYNNKGVDYVYWNKPKELVDRLRLLYSSKMAGNTGVNNEIVSLLEEMREEGLIY